MFFTPTLLEQRIIYMLKTSQLRWEKEDFTSQFILQPMSVFPEGQGARNLVCYCTITDHLASV